MGTRNLTAVYEDGKYKVAQYGQWDGYPSGQGLTILRFVRDAENVSRLKENLKRSRFYDSEKDKEWLEAYGKACPKYYGDPDPRTPEQIHWFKSYITRDLGGEILESIANSKDEEILLKDSIGFAGDSLFCEYAYVVDLDENTLEVYSGFNKEPLKEDERFYGLKQDQPDYFPVKFIHSFQLDSLPEEKEFLNILEPRDDDEDE